MKDLLTTGLHPAPAVCAVTAQLPFFTGAFRIAWAFPVAPTFATTVEPGVHTFTEHRGCAPVMSTVNFDPAMIPIPIFDFEMDFATVMTPGLAEPGTVCAGAITNAGGAGAAATCATATVATGLDGADGTDGVGGSAGAGPATTAFQVAKRVVSALNAYEAPFA